MANYTAKDLYNLQGITEFEEKCIVLSLEEIASLQSDVELGINSELVHICKLPFPKFIEAYLYKYEEQREKFENDQSLGFKLYMLPPHSLKTYIDSVKNPGKYSSDHLRHSAIEMIYSILEENFTSLIGTDSSTLNVMTNKRLPKFVYISQYIDLNTSKMLGLPVTSFFERDGVDGFEFEKKFECLNTAEKYILVKYLGLFGENMHSMLDIKTMSSIPFDSIRKFLNFILPLFTRPLGEFKHGIGLVDKDYRIDETKEYVNPEYRDLDVKIQLFFIRENILTDEERIILSTLSPMEANIYIASKHMYSSPEQVAKNLKVSNNMAGSFKVKKD